MSDQSPSTGTGISPEDLDRIAAQVARILGLQRLDDITSGDRLFARSGVSKSCSANSNGCEIHCGEIKAPTPSTPTTPSTPN